MVCSLQIYHEGLGHPAYEEPKQYDIRDINSIMKNYAAGWKAFENPRHFPPPYNRQKGWKRVEPPDNGGHIGIHDFDDDGVPELMIGDGISIGIFIYEDGMAKKIADLYEPEVWGCINGAHYRENTIILVNNGSDGSCYVCLSYHDGEYVTGVFDEYNPDTATVNGKEVTEEEFKKWFDIAGLSRDSSIPRSRMKKEDGIATILVIDAIRQEDEYILIKDLDFGAIKW